MRIVSGPSVSMTRARRALRSSESSLARTPAAIASASSTRAVTWRIRRVITSILWALNLWALNPACGHGSFLVGQRALAPHVAVVSGRFEHVARGHLAAVDVQGDRRRLERVGEDVVLERRNQAAGGSHRRVDAASGLEAARVGRFL